VISAFVHFAKGKGSVTFSDFRKSGHLQMVLAEYVAYFNHWRPHRSIGQRAPCAIARPTYQDQSGEIIGKPVLGGLHHVYHLAA